MVLECRLADENATIRLGEDIAAILNPGDVIALQGDLGAGKTTLARGLIRALAGDPGLDVPSPTFTLVQSYDGLIPLHHFDLYRLSSPDELDELGLNDAADDGAVIIEWPERAGNRLPENTVLVRLTDDGAGRIAKIEQFQQNNKIERFCDSQISGNAPESNAALLSRMKRSLEVRRFLEHSGWGEAKRLHLTGDASARSYEYVSIHGRPRRIIMDSPPLVLGPPVRGPKAYAEIARSARSVHAFAGVAKLLGDAGVTVPEIYARDLEQGLLLIEDLGSGSFLSAGGEPVAKRYELAAQLLAFIHERRWPDGVEVAPGTIHVIPPFDRQAMLIEAELVLDWYIPAFTGTAATDDLRAQFTAVWNRVLDRLEATEKTLMLRDVQAPNFIWRPDRRGFDQLGVIDFQDALIGPSAYDVASLALDPRVTISPQMEHAVIEAYAAARGAGFDRAAFDEAYAILGAQRHSKILGLFVRLDQRDGKPAYLKHLPRIRHYLHRVLGHPVLHEVKALYLQMKILEEEDFG